MVIIEKIRLYPNKSQRILIDKILEECKDLYNFLLECHNDTKDTFGWSPLNRQDCNKFINCFKTKYMSGVVKQRVHIRVMNAIKRFISNQNNRPKFKSINEYRSFEYSISTSCRLYFNKSTIMFGRIGHIKANFTREICGKPKTCTLKKLPSNEYYAFVTVEHKNYKPQIPITNRKSNVGIDVGIKTFLTGSDGIQIKKPFFKNKCKEHDLNRAQRRLSHKKRGSKNYEKQLFKLNKIHQKITNQRRDHHFKVAHYLVHNYETICCEKLNLKKLIKKKSKKELKKNNRTTYKIEKEKRKTLLDISLYDFMQILKYMGQKYSSNIIDVDPKNTTQECSICGTIVHKSLNNRQHTCPTCGLDCDRDLNAAWNILKKGIGECGTVGTTESIKLVEIEIPGLN